MKLQTENGERVRNFYRNQGAKAQLERVIEQIERNLCFDSLADPDGRCGNHGGKCYEFRQLINKLKGN